MKEDKIVNGYYESKIKTSRNEDSVYAMKYASQQMIIDKLETNWKELKKWLNARVKIYDDRQKLGEGYELTQAMTIDLSVMKNVLNKMQELESDK